MLGVVGLLAPEFFHLPMFTPGATPYESVYTVRYFSRNFKNLARGQQLMFYSFSLKNSGERKLCGVVVIIGALHDTFSEGVLTARPLQVPGIGLVQIFLAVGALELKMHGGKISKDDMFDGGRVSWLAICAS